MDHKTCDHCSQEQKKPWFTNKLFILCIIYALIFIFSPFVSFLAPLNMALSMYLKQIFGAILLGLFLGGVIDWLIPREYISKLLAAQKKRTIVYAVVAGFLMSACSHGILALAIQLYKKGASPPAVVAFLLSSPWANLPLTILMFGFFGPKALLIIFSAVIIALISGYIFMFFEKNSLIEHNPNTVAVDDAFSVLGDAGMRIKNIRFTFDRIGKGMRGVWEGSVSLANMVLWWILLGILLSSIVAAYLPSGFMQQYMGPTLLGLLVTLLLATIIEVCSEGSAPLSFEIFRQTGALGNSFVFLMAGVVTDYTEIGLLWTNIGWRTAVLLPIVTLPQVLILGWVFNLLF